MYYKGESTKKRNQRLDVRLVGKTCIFSVVLNQSNQMIALNINAMRSMEERERKERRTRALMLRE